MLALAWYCEPPPARLVVMTGDVVPGGVVLVDPLMS